MIWKLWHEAGGAFSVLNWTLVCSSKPSPDTRELRNINNFPNLPIHPVPSHGPVSSLMLTCSSVNSLPRKWTSRSLLFRQELMLCFIDSHFLRNTYLLIKLTCEVCTFSYFFFSVYTFQTTKKYWNTVMFSKTSYHIYLLSNLLRNLIQGTNTWIHFQSILLLGRRAIVFINLIWIGLWLDTMFKSHDHCWTDLSD